MSLQPLLDDFGVLPKGYISAYVEGAPIPQGWAICDGKNGTLDLRGKFNDSFINGAGTIGVIYIQKVGDNLDFVEEEAKKRGLW